MQMAIAGFAMGRLMGLPLNRSLARWLGLVALTVSCAPPEPLDHGQTAASATLVAVEPTNSPFDVFASLTENHCGELDFSQNPNLRYFGYFNSSAVYGDFSPEMTGNANLAFVANSAWNTCEGVIDPQADIDRIVSAAQHGQQSILYVSGIFWRFPDNRPNPNADACWKAYSQALEPYKRYIAAFYAFDEPYSNALAARGIPSVIAADTPAEKQALRTQVIQETRLTLEHEADVIKADFPDSAVATIFVGSEAWESDIPVPNHFDWIGMDCYGSFEYCQYSHASIAETFDRLKAKMGASQSLMLVPDGTIYLPHDGSPTDEQLAHLASTFHQYLAFANAEPRVRVILPFLWHAWDQGDGMELRGVGHLPSSVKGLYQAAGNCIGRYASDKIVFSLSHGDLARSLLDLLLTD